MAEGRIVHRRFASEALADNPLGDPAERELLVWLPPDYDEGERRYPVLYVLAGFTGRGRSLLNDSPWAPGFDRRLDLLLAAGRIEPVVAVFPDCFTKLGGSQYLDSPALGRYETYLVEEVVPFVDREFRTLGPGHRGVMGKSSGGYGALRLAMRHPGLFRAVASHAGDMAFELCYQRDFAPAARTLARAGGPDAFLEAFFAKGEKKSSEDICALNVLAMAAAYSPRPDGGFDLPFDLNDLRLDDEVWARWLACDPLRMLEDESCREALRRLDVLYLDAGLKDQFLLDFGLRRFVRRLDELGVRYVHEEFPDDHFSTSYRYDRSLPLLTRALSSTS